MEPHTFENAGGYPYGVPQPAPPTHSQLPPTPPLPLFPLQVEEFWWLEPEPIPHAYIWDDRYDTDVATTTEEVSPKQSSTDDTLSDPTDGPVHTTETLLRKAREDILTRSEQMELIKTLQKDEEWTRSISPLDIPQFAVHNVEIGAALLRPFLSADNRDEYLLAIADTPLTMRIAGLLSRTSDALPRDFIHRYLVEAAASCARMEEREDRDRRVHIVCKLINALERQGNLVLQDLGPELQSFALENSRSADAVALYQRLISTQ